MDVETLKLHAISIEKHRQSVKDALGNFLARYNLQAILGISGGGSERDLERATNIISDLVKNLGGLSVAILTGGTKEGIPEIGLRIARASSLPTIGVFPEQGRKYALFEQIDLAIETIPPSYGESIFSTETPTYVQLVDGVAVIGGSAGTLVEVATIMKINDRRLRRGGNIVYLCPISGTGGVADIIPNLPGIEKVTACLPEKPVYDGISAASFFKEKLANRKRDD